ncbi:MAG TPA: tyrosine protein phosphatase [Isosphaeraceae bacterium]
MLSRRPWTPRLVVAALVALACQQAWRHGQDYVFIDKFAVVEPGRIYRGAWQQDWPMRRLVRTYKIKTVVALAHPPGDAMAQKEHALGRELGFRWVHIPIVDDRSAADGATLFDQLEQAAAVLADPANQPVFFHCHHGINRASMVQIAYRTRHCGWTLEQATAEISRTVGLVEVTKGPDYRRMTDFYRQRVLPRRHPGVVVRRDLPAPPATR